MARGPIPITKRSDLTQPISAAQNDETLQNLKDGILHSTESTDPDHPWSVAADASDTGAGLLPEDYEVRGSYSEIKTPAALGLPASVTDDLVLVRTEKLRLNADDGAAVQTAFTQTDGEYRRQGTAAAWGAWQGFNQAATLTTMGLVELATDAEAQAGVDAARAVTPASLAAVTATETRRGLAELATQSEVNTGTDIDRIVTPATLAGRTATDARAGVVELATDAEVQTGTDTARAVTPAGLAARTATLTRSGVIELATQAEVNAGSDADRAVTPATLAGRAASTTMAGIIEIATEAEVRTGTDNVRAVSPLALQGHLGVAKAWVYVTGGATPVASASMNVGSVTDNAAGDFTVNFTTAFSSANYAFAGMTGHDGASPDSQDIRVSRTVAPTSSAFRLNTLANNSLTDFDRWSAVFFGDQ